MDVVADLVAATLDLRNALTHLRACQARVEELLATV
jgi:hypothetical protein